ncbi:hypothetical protein [Aquimarina sp. 2304DJ70-9]|uniref:hypothetical protein n=1 Tax=Aquimarina penaris TaxID=3231044 RepID=UPI003461EB5D
MKAKQFFLILRMILEPEFLRIYLGKFLLLIFIIFSVFSCKSQSKIDRDIKCIVRQIDKEYLMSLDVSKRAEKIAKKFYENHTNYKEDVFVHCFKVIENNKTFYNIYLSSKDHQIINNKSIHFFEIEIKENLFILRDYVVEDGANSVILKINRNLSISAGYLSLGYDFFVKHCKGCDYSKEFNELNENLKPFKN